MEIAMSQLLIAMVGNQPKKPQAQDSCVSSSHCGCFCFITTQQTGLKDRGHAVCLSNPEGSAVKESHQ